MHDDAAGAPVVLLGRGGSGTRILTQLGVANGVFIGNDVNASGDSVEWVDAVYELAIESTTSGVRAGSARDEHWRGVLRRRAAEVLQTAQLAPDDLWGWKLPETILALPQVVRTFPRARFVHLVRHPLTSALRRTHVTSRMSNAVGAAVLPAAYRAAGFDPARIEDDDEYVHNAVTWDFQVRGALDAFAAAPATRVLQLRYEDVCAAPGDALERVARFLDTPPPDASAAPAIDPARTNADVSSDERAAHVWAICGATAARLGYGVSPA